MRTPAVNDYVRLNTDVPHLHLARGEIGVVRSQWFAPEVAYEVEFHPHGTPDGVEGGLDHPTRALLMADQIRVEDGPMFDLRTVETHAGA
jgi:hypothetical protein